jgi:hypothetical protein
MLSFGAVAFAQTTGQSQPQTPATAGQQSQKQQITAVGCIEREADYRQRHQMGRGGTMGSGMGAGNEFVLVNATMGREMTSAGTPSGTTAGAPTGTGATSGTATGTTPETATGTTAGTATGTTSGTAAGTAGTTGTSAAAGAAKGKDYRLTGSRESELEKHVGQRVEISGWLQDHGGMGAAGRGTMGAGATGTASTGSGTTATGTASTGAATSGTTGAGATGDPAQSFEDLPEIEIVSFRAVGGSCPAR